MLILEANYVIIQHIIYYNNMFPNNFEVLD